MMLSRDLWPVTQREFEQNWTTYKKENGLLDFTDLIEACLRDVCTAPKNPSVIFADEASKSANNNSTTALALIRS
jgi:hypothetical protein